jgi:hypothetical protein
MRKNLERQDKRQRKMKKFYGRFGFVIHAVKNTGKPLLRNIGNPGKPVKTPQRGTE